MIFINHVIVTFCHLRMTLHFIYHIATQTGTLITCMIGSVQTNCHWRHTKTNILLSDQKHKQCDFSLHKLCINGTPLNRISQHCEETSAKFLGIYIDEYLTWQDHIIHVHRKMARAMFAIKQVKYLLPYNTMRNLYYALVHSHLSYAIVAWWNADRTITRKRWLFKNVQFHR